MTNKRQLEDSSASIGKADYGSWESTSQRQQQQQQQQQQRHPQQTLPGRLSFPDGAQVLPQFGGVTEYPGAVRDTPPEAVATLNGISTAPHWNAAGASAYPDVSSYQQPYFYQQTDPSIYNSPWPPAESGSYAVPGNHLLPPQPGGAMPFFPPHSTAAVEPGDGIDADAANFPQYSELESDPQYSYAVTSTRTEVPSPTSAFYQEDASVHVKVQSLSILDNLATQLIHTIAAASFPQIQDLMADTDSEDGQAYATLKNLFEQTRKVYSRETPLIDAIAVQMFQPQQQEIIRKANIATFISSILGSHDVSFFHLNEYFMETFVPLGHRLLKWQGDIYLELKTQTYISALMNSDGSPQTMLDELFPPDMDAQILTRHPDAPSLSPSETDFIDRSRARKNYLLAEPSSDESLRELPKKYQWNVFVRQFASCISKNVDGIVSTSARAQLVFGGSNALDRRVASIGHGAQASVFGASNGSHQHSVEGMNGKLPPGLNLSSQAGGPHDGQAGADATKRAPAAAQATRQPSRQPWSKPEEDALLSGLERVNGPHWSQILALYGRGGSVNEELKDRNQVQLKDKARNLKLWYLKMGKVVPVALRGVTGELRKRGGARARAALVLAEDGEQANVEEAAAEEDGEGGGGNIDPSLDGIQSGINKKKTKK